ncbi:MAG: GNAT family N-acetyltransferase [Proteobacteria bacterium]|nr:GNAT family N-acetyltransferase [Pseudomonadota bacterium]NBX85890.1 GNAT family N-acetyltransferase [Pseudomonadota bacterium]
MTLPLKVLGPHEVTLATAARTFCLQTIKQTYGFDYNPAWHADLDSLCQTSTENPTDNQYAASNRGRFWVLLNKDGEVIGTMGVRSLAYKPNFKPILATYYPDFNHIASLWRTYLAPAYRGQGWGEKLNQVALEFARSQNYQRMFLECNQANTKLQAYWQRLGYQHFCNGDNFCCFDQPLHPAHHQT